MASLEKGLSLEKFILCFRTKTTQYSIIMHSHKIIYLNGDGIGGGQGGRRAGS